MSEPVVSPADTIRRLTEWANAELHTTEDVRRHQESYLPSKLRADMRALLAVGERDRRQIAQLTKALSRLSCAVVSENFNRPAGSPGMSSNLRVALDNAANVVRETRPARAVLAGEEDARP